MKIYSVSFTVSAEVLTVKEANNIRDQINDKLKDGDYDSVQIDDTYWLVDTTDTAEEIWDDITEDVSDEDLEHITHFIIKLKRKQVMSVTISFKLAAKARRWIKDRFDFSE